MVCGSVSRECAVIEWFVEHRSGGGLDNDGRTELGTLIDLLRSMPGRGWSLTECARRMGKSKQLLYATMRRKTIDRATMESIACCFDLGAREVYGLLDVVTKLREGAGKC